MIHKTSVAAALITLSALALTACNSSSGSVKDPNLTGNWDITLRPNGGSPFGSIAYVQHVSEGTTLNTADANNRFVFKFTTNAVGGGASGSGYQRTGTIEFKNDNKPCVIGRANGSFTGGSLYRGTYTINQCGQSSVTGTIEMKKQ